MTPSVWISHQLIGLTENGWLVWRTTRQVQSYYSYSVESVLVEVNQRSGCQIVHGDARQEDWRDSEASGQWSTSPSAADAPLTLPPQLTPVMPSGWQSQFVSNETGLLLDYYGDQQLLYDRTALVGWAKVQGIDLVDPVRLVGVQEPVHSWRGDSMVYVTLETAGRDIDIDYARFIVPVDLAAVIATQEAEASNGRASLALRAPAGC